MFRRIARISAPLTLILSVTLVWLSGGCGVNVTIAEVYDASPPAFAEPDADTVVAPEAGLTSYCPSNKCPAGFTTCPTSQFRCDVNLKADRDNCGACGFACPPSSVVEVYECVEGRCVLQCTSELQDCDGIIDNGCETALSDNENCGGCGKKCLDPAKPCVHRSGVFGDYGCGCAGDLTYCNGLCIDLKSDDNNCGACGNVCDRSGDGGVLPDYAYYGCGASKCGQLKCLSGYADCDGDPGNGCETRLDTVNNCGSCNNACGAGQDCKQLLFEPRPECVCAEGMTYCDLACFGSRCLGQCFDLATSKLNCGACGVDCTADRSDTMEPECINGMCVPRCLEGLADCNRNPEDGCEVNTDRDPRNCGACGRACDVVVGQACVGGQCVVEPCDSVDGGGVTAR